MGGIARWLIRWLFRWLIRWLDGCAGKGASRGKMQQAG